MTGIENHIEFGTTPRQVFKHLANPANIPMFVPGIRQASVVDPAPEGVGTRVALTTRHGHHLEAVIEGEVERRFIAIRDAHGVVNEWELRDAPNGGTLAVNRILGVSPDQREELAHDARSKLFAFKEFVETRNGHR